MLMAPSRMVVMDVLREGEIEMEKWRNVKNGGIVHVCKREDLRISSAMPCDGVKPEMSGTSERVSRSTRLQITDHA